MGQKRVRTGAYKMLSKSSPGIISVTTVQDIARTPIYIAFAAKVISPISRAVPQQYAISEEKLYTAAIEIRPNRIARKFSKTNSNERQEARQIISEPAIKGRAIDAAPPSRCEN